MNKESLSLTRTGSDCLPQAEVPVISVMSTDYGQAMAPEASGVRAGTGVEKAGEKQVKEGKTGQVRAIKSR